MTPPLPPCIRVIDMIANDELPAELRTTAKEQAGRKVIRMLDRISLAPFVAAMALNARQNWTDLDRVGLFTVSGWDPATPVPASLVRQSDSETAASLAIHYYLHPPSVTDYLRRMANNAICQIAIATQFRGPNVHFTGGADSLALITALAASAISDKAAEAAVVIAFDPPDGDRAALPDDADSAAAAFVLASSDDAASPGVALDELLAGLDAAPPSAGAVATLQSWMTSLRSMPGVR
jgi:hypothetical protein